MTGHFFSHTLPRMLMGEDAEVQSLGRGWLLGWFPVGKGCRSWLRIFPTPWARLREDFEINRCQISEVQRYLQLGLGLARYFTLMIPQL